MSWWLLILAGLFEVVGVIGIKRVSVENNWTNNLILIGGFLVSFRLLLQAMETISLSTAYAVWTGIGTVGGAGVGMIFFKESKKPLRLLRILGIVVCVAALSVVEWPTRREGVAARIRAVDPFGWLARLSGLFFKKMSSAVLSSPSASYHKGTKPKRGRVPCLCSGRPQAGMFQPFSGCFRKRDCGERAWKSIQTVFWDGRRLDTLDDLRVRHSRLIMEV